MKKIITILSFLASLSYVLIFFVLAEKQPTTNIIYLHQQDAITRSYQSTFNELIASGDVVLKFYADWCGPCRRMSPLIDSIAATMPHITFIYIDRDQFLELAKNFGITSIPTLIFLRNGRVIGRYDGKPLSQNELARLIINMFNKH